MGFIPVKKYEYRSAEGRELGSTGGLGSAGCQGCGDAPDPSYFLPGTGPEPLDPGMLSMGMLSDNEKRFATIGVLGIVGWFFFGKKIKKAFKKALK